MTDSKEQQKKDFYNSHHASASRLIAIIASCTFVTGLLLPWAAMLIAFTHHPSVPIARVLAITGEPNIARIPSLDCLAISGAFVGFSIYRALGRQIETGGLEADSLDRIRLQFSSLLMIAAMLFLFTMGPR